MGSDSRTEYVVFRKDPHFESLSQPVRGGSFPVKDGRTEESAMAEAIEMADVLLERDRPIRFVVKRIQTETVWEGKGR